MPKGPSADAAAGFSPKFPPWELQFSPKLRIIISHAIPLVSTGLLGMLRGMPDCDVRIWSEELQKQYGSPREAGAHIVVSDAAKGREILADAGCQGRLPRVIVVVSEERAEGAAGILSKSAAACLPIDADRQEVIHAVRKVGASVRPSRAALLAASVQPGSALATLGQEALEKHAPHAAASRAVDCRPPEAPPRGGLPPATLRRVCEHIERGVTRGVRPRELAAIAGLSESHFSRAFKESVGVPPHRYVSWRRVEAAAKLIRDTAQPLAQISLAVGFSDQSHFTRTFLRLIGETPGAFRRRHR